MLRLLMPRRQFFASVLLPYFSPLWPVSLADMLFHGATCLSLLALPRCADMPPPRFLMIGFMPRAFASLIFSCFDAAPLSLLASLPRHRRFAIDITQHICRVELLRCRYYEAILIARC